MKDVPRQTTFAKRNNETRGNFSGSEHVIVFLVLFLRRKLEAHFYMKVQVLPVPFQKKKKERRFRYWNFLLCLNAKKSLAKNITSYIWTHA